ncbi:MAG: transketolase C-terminal domain-containing protein, partial [bacterium]|nr:transketolase C-terminal domain-containing protein [bacterium]
PEKIVVTIEQEVEHEINLAWEKASEGKPACGINKISEYGQSPERVEVAESQRKLSYREAVAEAYLQAMENDPRVFLIGEGVDGITGIYGTTLLAYKKFGPSRVIDTPISDAAITGIAIGAAIVGMRPVIMHQRNDFMLVVMDQIVSHAAFWKYMTGGRLSVPVTIRSYVARKSGEAGQHTGSWQAMFGHVPGLKVVMPSTAYDAKGLTLAAISDDDPVLILENRVLNENEDAVPETPYSVSIGKAKIVKSGKDITIVAVSAAVLDALKAADVLLENNQISAEVIDLVSIRPIDKETLFSSVRKTGKMIAVDTGFKTCGVGAELCALVAEELGPVTVRRIGMKEVPAPAADTLVRTGYHPDAKQIVEIAKEMFLN